MEISNNNDRNHHTTNNVLNNANLVLSNVEEAEAEIVVVVRTVTPTNDIRTLKLHNDQHSSKSQEAAPINNVRIPPLARL
jgi:hypothetical protein